jgi:indole-3-glycerol phosphate synthase
MDKLSEIIEYKRMELDGLRRAFDNVVGTATVETPSFYDALAGRADLAVIAEVKRRSPSLGDIDAAADPVERARMYEDGGASAVSVLTDEHFFGGSFGFLRDVSKAVRLPTLCKDYVIDRVQIDLARANLASAVLLIADALSDRELRDLYEYASALGLDVLVEGHKPENIRRAAELSPRIIGINNRSLFTFEEDPEHAVKQAALLPDAALRLYLSSVRERADVERAAGAGFDGVLVGTALMKAFNVKATVRSFTGIPKSRRAR